MKKLIGIVLVTMTNARCHNDQRPLSPNTTKPATGPDIGPQGVRLRRQRAFIQGRGILANSPTRCRPAETFMADT